MKALSTILGSLLLFMILASGTVALIEYYKSIENKLSISYKEYQSMAQSLELSRKASLIPDDKGGLLLYADNSILGFDYALILYPNGSFSRLRPQDVFRGDNGKYSLPSTIASELLSGAVMIGVRADGTYLTLDKSNIKENKSFPTTANASAIASLISLTQYMLGSRTSYRLFMVEHNGLKQAALEKVMFPITVNVSLWNVKPVIYKTGKGCPTTQKRIERWGIRANYSLILSINNHIFENESGELLYTTTSNYGWFNPRYTVSTDEIKLEVPTKLNEDIIVKVVIGINFKMRAPSPFVCTNYWTIYYPDYWIDESLYLRIRYNGSGVPMLLVDNESLALLGETSTVFLDHYYRMVDNMAIYFNSSDNTILDAIIKRRVSGGYLVTAYIENPELIYLIGILS